MNCTVFVFISLDILCNPSNVSFECNCFFFFKIVLKPFLRTIKISSIMNLAFSVSNFIYFFWNSTDICCVCYRTVFIFYSLYISLNIANICFKSNTFSRFKLLYFALKIIIVEFCINLISCFFSKQSFELIFCHKTFFNNLIKSSSSRRSI